MALPDLGCWVSMSKSDMESVNQSHMVGLSAVTALVVMRDDFERALLRTLLATMGVSCVLEASDQTHALAIAEEHSEPIHLVIMESDWQLVSKDRLVKHCARVGIAYVCIVGENRHLVTEQPGADIKGLHSLSRPLVFCQAIEFVKRLAKEFMKSPGSSDHIQRYSVI
jgi:CheY-like chemotaxis protein